MTQAEAVAALLEGPKTERAEYAITAEMYAAVESYRKRRKISKSAALRKLTAQALVTFGGYPTGGE